MQAPKPEAAHVLAKASKNAVQALGLPVSALAKIVGRDKSAITRSGIDPDSKAGELAKFVVRIYRSLHVMMGGDRESMAHWMKTRNRHLNGVPAELVLSVQGLVGVMEYLDAMRGKV